MSAAIQFVMRIGPGVIKLALAVVLVTSGFVHVGNCFLYLSSILEYDMVGPRLAIAVAGFLPFLQIAVALELMTQVKNFEYRGLIWAMLLFGFFSFVQIFAYGRDLEISCGCFGAASEQIGPISLAWSIGGFVLSIVGAILCRIGKVRIAKAHA